MSNHDTLYSKTKQKLNNNEKKSD